MLDLVHVRSFVEVAERGTVAAAARATEYTSPAVSQHLAKLESELAVPLFDRVRGRLRLSAAGEALLPVAHELLDLEVRARRSTTAPPVRPHVVFAGFASAISTVLLPRLNVLRRHATFEIVEQEDAEALRDLRLGHVDVVLTQEYDCLPAERDPRFDHVAVARDELRLVLPPGSDISTTLNEVRGHDWLLNGSGTRCSAAARQIAAAAGFEPHVVGNIADNTALLGLVAAGEGVAVVPELVVGPQSEVVVSRHRLGVGRTIVAVLRSGARGFTPLVDALRDEVEES